MTLDDLSCPQCRGPLDFAETNHVFRCAVCEITLIADVPESSLREGDENATWQDRAVQLGHATIHSTAAGVVDAIPDAAIPSDTTPPDVETAEDIETIENAEDVPPESADAPHTNLPIDSIDVSSPSMRFEFNATATGPHGLELEDETGDESSLQLDDLDMMAEEPTRLPVLPARSSAAAAYFHDLLHLAFEPTVDPQTRTCPMCGLRIPSSAEKCESCGEDFADSDSRINVKSGPSGSRHMLYAGFLQRFLALCVDFVLIGTPLAVLIVTVISTMHLEFPGLFSRTTNFIPFGPYRVILFVVAWPYFALMESSERRATLGKRLLGLVVVDRRGERVSFIRASVRYFCRVPAEVLCLIGYVMSIFTDKRQGLHDLVSGCLIVRKQ